MLLRPESKSFINLVDWKTSPVAVLTVVELDDKDATATLTQDRVRGHVSFVQIVVLKPRYHSNHVMVGLSTAMIASRRYAVNVSL